MLKSSLSIRFALPLALFLGAYSLCGLGARLPKKPHCISRVLAAPTGAEGEIIRLSGLLQEITRLQKLAGVWLSSSPLPHSTNEVILFGTFVTSRVPLIFFHYPYSYSLFPLEHLEEKIRKRATTAQNAAERTLTDVMQNQRLASFYLQDLVPEVEVGFGAGSQGFRVPIFPTVSTPIMSYTKALVQAAASDAQGARTILIVGCGTGAEAVFWAKTTQAFIQCIDINPWAVANTQVTARVHGLEDRILAWDSDLFQTVTGRYDLLLANLPLRFPRDQSYPDTNLFDQDGVLLQRFVREFSAFLTPKGKAFAMTWPQIEAELPLGVATRKVLDFEDEASQNLAIHELTSPAGSP
jgi:SAM-dependent methyltransferase